MKTQIVAMLVAIVAHTAAASAATAGSPTSQPTPAADGAAHVYLIDGKSRTELRMAQAVPAPGPQPRPGLLPQTTYTSHMGYALTGSRAASAAPASPVFEVSIAGVPWTDPHTTPVIIRLDVKSDRRVIGDQASHLHILSGKSTTDPITDNRIATKVESIGNGRFRVTPGQPLAPGEYGVALRDPDVQSETYSTNAAPDTSKMSRQQMYQLYVWDFSVNTGGQTQ